MPEVDPETGVPLAPPTVGDQLSEKQEQLDALVAQIEEQKAELARLDEEVVQRQGQLAEVEQWHREKAALYAKFTKDRETWQAQTDARMAELAAQHHEAFTEWRLGTQRQIDVSNRLTAKLNAVTAVAQEVVVNEISGELADEYLAKLEKAMRAGEGD